MRILICGDRNWTNEEAIRAKLKKYLSFQSYIVVIEGECRGADLLGRKAAESLGITVLPFPADWDKFGKAAGPIRNQRMLDEGNPSLVLAFHNDIKNSKGTKDMITRAEKAHIPVVVISDKETK